MLWSCKPLTWRGSSPSRTMGAHNRTEAGFETGGPRLSKKMEWGLPAPPYTELPNEPRTELALQSKTRQPGAPTPLFQNVLSSWSMDSDLIHSLSDHPRVTSGSILSKSPHWPSGHLPCLHQEQDCNFKKMGNPLESDFMPM